MVKKYLLLLVVFSFLLFLSCDKDNKDDCRKKGFLSATWSDGQSLKFNYNDFTPIGTDKVSLNSASDVEFCTTRLSISVPKFSTAIGRHELAWYKGIGEFDEQAAILFTQDDDALTETYVLDTLQTNWVNVDEVSSDRIKGIINATFILREGARKAWDFSDTLYITQEPFELGLRK